MAGISDLHDGHAALAPKVVNLVQAHLSCRQQLTNVIAQVTDSQLETLATQYTNAVAEAHRVAEILQALAPAIDALTARFTAIQNALPAY